VVALGAECQFINVTRKNPGEGTTDLEKEVGTEKAPGALADLVTVALDTPRLAGTAQATALESVIFAATAADVRSVVAGGRDVVRDGRHVLVADVPRALAAAIGAVLD
jgi:hypothetical protein